MEEMKPIQYEKVDAISREEDMERCFDYLHHINIEYPILRATKNGILIKNVKRLDETLDENIIEAVYYLGVIKNE